MRGDVVATTKSLESGDHPYCVVSLAVTGLPGGICFPLFLSQKVMPPAKFPNPAKLTNRPCGAHETVFWCRLPNKNVAFPSLPLCKDAIEGIRPAATAKQGGFSALGIHPTSSTGPSCGNGTAIASFVVCWDIKNKEEDP
mmetsp:Transcript_19266/g.41877  ORF Transcript_19266/g.41877 Transcript_19266/m.41877 type:complete len:140 (-) Transcript_19266:955-1374(-)